MNSVDEAIGAHTRWGEAFIAHDVDGMIAEMHFPHMRLSGPDLQVWERKKISEHHSPSRHAGSVRKDLARELWTRSTRSNPGPIKFIGQYVLLGKALTAQDIKRSRHYG